MKTCPVCQHEFEVGECQVCATLRRILAKSRDRRLEWMKNRHRRAGSPDETAWFWQREESDP